MESILSIICWVWLPALLVSLHHSERRQQPRLYEWSKSPPEAGDGTDPNVMSLQRQGEEREHYETSHSFFCLSLSLPAVPTPGSLVLWWVHITGWWLTLPPAQSPLTHPGCSLVIFPCPALPSPTCSSPIDFGPARKNPNFTPTLWRTGEEGC